MTLTTVSSTEFARHPSRVVKATSIGPVFITERGKQSHVLLSIEEYERLTGAKVNLKLPPDDCPRKP